jgi:hypothetical protein
MTNTALTGATYDIDGGQQLPPTKPEPRATVLSTKQAKVPASTRSRKLSFARQRSPTHVGRRSPHAQPSLASSRWSPTA